MNATPAPRDPLDRASRIPSKGRFTVEPLSAIVSSRHAARQPFQRFLDEHRRPVLAFLRAMVGPDDAEDCFQETFIAAMRAYERHGRALSARLGDDDRPPQGDRPPPRPRPAPEPREDVPEVAAPAASGGLGDLDGEVWSAVAELSDAQRAAVALRYAGDLAYREIAAALEISEEAARRRVADGLRALRENDRPRGGGAMTHRRTTGSGRSSASGTDERGRRGRRAAGRARRRRRASWTSPTRASTRRWAPATSRRPRAGSSRSGCRTSAATRFLAQLASGVSPRVLELPRRARRGPPRAR